MPDGEVELWIVVYADDGAFMGAAPARCQPRWTWHGGCLSRGFSSVIAVSRRGRARTGLICALSAATRAYRPVAPVDLREPGKPDPGELKAGDVITIRDGFISFRSDLPGPRA
jgi:hypothetical protein